MYTPENPSFTTRKCFLREGTKINVCYSLELSYHLTLNLIDYQRIGTDLTEIMYSQVNPMSETEFNRHRLYKGTT